MKNYPKYLKTTLNSVIRSMAKHPKDFCVDPEKNFTRSRKLHFEDMISLLVKMGGKSLHNELLNSYNYSVDTATVSAFVQQRAKIKPEALACLFRQFTDTCATPKLYKGCQLLAVDGSDLQFTANPNDPQSYFPGVNGQMHYSFLHLNALYDLNSRIYRDAVVQKKREVNENAALIEMIERMDEKHPAIIIADRGFESYHVMELIRKKGWRFLIRLRKAQGILTKLPLPEGDFDLTFQIYLTRKQNKKTKALMKENPGIYRFLPSQHPFPYLPKDSSDFYLIPLRVVRFPISDTSMETLVTNLDEDAFPMEELKQLYHLRWDIETSFRQLKYTIGLSQFQSKKVENITQEIFARLTMYNFCELITSHVVIQNKNRKLTYQVNFSAAVHICRKFLRGSVAPPNVEALIKKEVVPIRPGRSTPRKTKNIKFKGFLYRIA